MLVRAGVDASQSGAFETRDNALAIENSKLKELSKRAMQQLYDDVRQRIGSDTESQRLTETGPLRERIDAAIAAMQSNLVERDTEVRLLLLAALSGEHILFIGPPGTAKSELGRRLSKLCAGSFFERLLTKFSVPEELFGPLSMRALENDQYVRQIEGYLPEARVAFIDEIFKANSAILNTLLTVLNERLFDNGAERIKIPLLCLVGASNELPESEELDALYDRFLLRRRVAQVTAGGLVELLSSAGTPRESTPILDATQCLLIEDFEVTRLRAREEVKIPPHVVHLMADLRSWLQEKCEPPVYVSDRRLVKAVDLMRVSAYCNGRSEVTDYDTLLLQHVFWNQPEEADRIYDWLLDNLAADSNTEQIDYLLSGLFGRACRQWEDRTKLRAIVGEIKQLKDVLTDKLSYILNAVDGGFPELLDHVWLAEDEAKAVMHAVLPKLENSRKGIEATLFEVVALEQALELELSQGVSPRAGVVRLATLMPRHWQRFIREAPSDEQRLAACCGKIV